MRRTPPDLFEYGVILNGGQTGLASIVTFEPFEYGVILNGSQTGVTVCHQI